MTISGEHMIGRSGRAVAEEISHRTLKRLLTGSLACIWHKGWYDVNSAKHAITDLLQSRLVGPADSTEVRNIGPPVGSAFKSESATERYFDESVAFWGKLRQKFFVGLQNPIDGLLNAFDGIWPAGAAPGARQGRAFSHGIFRWFPQGASLNPHVDNSLEPLIAPLCPTARLAACVYLVTTSSTDGGRLELWDLALSHEQYEILRAPDFSLPRAVIGAPALAIAPEPGDLIIFDAQRIHAVSPIHRGSRLTASSFIGFSRVDEPLVFFA